MRIFISWSGHIGKVAAETLRSWLPRVLPYAKPWFSSDIEPGKVGAHRILESLRDADAGIVVITPESQCSPWVLFESGALAKDDKLFPYVLGVGAHELLQPYPHFQYRVCNRTDTNRLVTELNAFCSRIESAQPLISDEVEAKFDANWPSLEPTVRELHERAARYSRERHFGQAAVYVSQAKRETAEAKARAEHQEFRAELFKRIIIEHLLSYEHLLHHPSIPPERLLERLERDVKFFKPRIEDEDFGELEMPEPYDLMPVFED